MCAIVVYARARKSSSLSYLWHKRVLKKTLLPLPPRADSASICVNCGAIPMDCICIGIGII